MKTPISVTAIIPTLNEEKFIGNILRDLQEQSYKPHQTIVVDGDSVDNTKDVVQKFEDVTFITGPKPQGSQRNFAATKARGEMLLFLDADTRINPNFIEKSMLEIEKRDLSIAIPTYHPYSQQTKLFYHFFSHVFNAVLILASKINPLGGACGMFITKKLFDETDGFAAKYKIDDVPLVRQAAKKGRYGILKSGVRVSERRFERYGKFRMTINYFIYWICFAFNAYDLANKMEYRFGEFGKQSS